MEDYVYNLYDKIDEAYQAFYQRRDFYFIFKPIDDFFDTNVIPNNTYDARQIIMMNNYAKSLQYYDFPEAQYWYAKRLIIEESG